MSSEITRYEEGENITLAQSPQRVLSDAKKAADSLISVVSQKSKPVKFGGETYLEFEDWQMVGKFYGCTAKVTRVEFVNYGDVKGFDATAVVVDRLGNEISSAESMCLNDEENWGAVPKYEWKDVLVDGKKVWDKGLRNGKGGYKAEKVQVGTEPKPLFQLKSMAQTRACAKALRNVFSWVVVLAGYKPGVAEELNESQFAEDKPPVEENKAAPTVQRKSEKAKMPPVNAAATAAKPEPAICSECRVQDGHAEGCKYAQRDAREKGWKAFVGHDPEKHINFKQGALLFVVQGKKGITDEQLKTYMLKHLNVEHRPLILKEHYAALLEALDPEFEYHQPLAEPAP